MTQPLQPSFLVDVIEGHIHLTPVTDEGRRLKAQRLSIDTAARLCEALQKAVLAAKVQYWT